MYYSISVCTLLLKFDIHSAHCIQYKYCVANIFTFIVNPKTVDNDIGPEYKLVDYIRDKARLKGTKYMCREGGCGCCVVTVKTRNSSGVLESRSVNSVTLKIKR